jgi:kumamolisin
LDQEGSRRIRNRSYLSAEQLVSRFGAAGVDILKVERFANERGLSVVGASRQRRTVTINGTVDKFSKAFDVKLSMYRSPRGTYRGHDGPVRITAELKDIVEGVFGLDTKPQHRWRVCTTFLPG